MTIIDDLNPKDTEAERLARFGEISDYLAEHPETVLGPFVLSRLRLQEARTDSMRVLLDRFTKYDEMRDGYRAHWNAKPWHEKARIRIRNKLSSIGSRIHDAWMVLIGRADIGDFW